MMVQRLLIAFVILLGVHAFTLGISDDEAYYWVLGQNPMWGYAYHPGAIGWISALLGPGAHAGVFRLFGVLVGLVILEYGYFWLKSFDLTFNETLTERTSLMTLWALPGVFGAIWMMVPDVPLLLGWLLLFWPCFESLRSRGGATSLFFGAVLVLNSKYSGVLLIVSSAWACWANYHRRFRDLLPLILGLFVGVIPWFISGSEHGWGALAYQLSERHRGEISWMRYLRFWLVQVVIVGPALIVFLVLQWKRIVGIEAPSAKEKSLIAFLVPSALVFFIQPIFSDFKIHWALVAWLPVSFWFAHRVTKGEYSKLARVQRWYALVLVGLFLMACQFPAFAVWVKEPKVDVTNDFYGWTEVAAFLKSDEALAESEWPVTASRYQTASQMAFALNDWKRVELVPRDQKSASEWIDHGVIEPVGPEWSKLLRPVLFVSDYRYTAGPEYLGADCTVWRHFTATRKFFSKSYPSRTVDLWKCLPKTSAHELNNVAAHPAREL